MKALTLIRGAIIALAIGTSAVPAQAQMGFSFGFGNGFSNGGYYGRHGGWHDDHGYRRHWFRCVEMTDRQVRRSVAARGYRNVSLNVRDDRRITVRATRNGRTYLLRVDTCTGAILYRDRIRRH